MHQHGRDITGRASKLVSLIPLFPRSMIRSLSLQSHHLPGWEGAKLRGGGGWELKVRLRV